MRIAGIAAKWTTASYVGDACAGLEFVEPGVRRQCVEHLSGISQIDAKVGHTWLSQRHEIAIDHAVTVVDEMTDRMPTGLSTAPGEEDSHVADGTEDRRGDRFIAAVAQRRSSWPGA